MATLVVLLVAPASSDAQVRQDRAKDAYIGVNLAERCTYVQSGAVCEHSPVIRSVVIGGPADLAGVRTGDVLLSVDGADLTTTEGRAALYGLQRSVPVELSVRRGDEVVNVEVVPERLASERQVRFLPMAPQFPEAVEETRTMVVRELDEEEHGFTVEIETVQSAAGPDAPLEGAGFVVVQTDSAGTTRVRLAVPKTFVLTGPGDSAVSADYSWRFVLRDAELADRLQAVQRSARVGARARIDSLLRVHGVVRETEEHAADGVWVRAEDAEPFTPVSPAELARMARNVPTPDVRRLFEFRNRAAGAEFQVLTPQLAEYFPGARDGLLVLRVIPGTPAARLGLEQGDVVTEISGKTAADMSVLQNALTHSSDADGIDVKWLRKGTVLEGTLATH